MKPVKMIKWMVGSLPPASLALLFAALFIGSPSLRAGEKIEIGKTKSKVQPAKDSQLGKELFKWREKLETDAMSPNLPMMVNPGSDPFDPRKERRRKEKMEEQRNWMVKDQRTDQEEKEAILKELEGTSDDFMTQEDSKDKWYNDFKNKQAGNSNTRQPGQLTARNNNSQNPQSKPYTEEDDDIVRSFRSSPLAAKSGPEVGAHTSSEMDFKKLFETARSDAASSKSVKLDTDSYVPNSPFGLGRTQPSNRDEFKAFLTGGPQSSPKSGVTLQLGDAPGMLTEKSFLNPGKTAPDITTPNRFTDPFAPPGNLSRSGFDASPLRRDLNQSGISGLGTLPTGLIPGSSMNQPLNGFEQPTRARGMNSLGGH